MASFYEFFAGGGMVRAGLGSDWSCVFANDIDSKKAESYSANWGGESFCLADISSLNVKQLPDRADLAWASFPCQDLSLAGNGAGLDGDRSGTFWPFWMLLKSLQKEGRSPRIVALENVCGTLTSHGGKDFLSIVSAITLAGYRVGALVIDAVRFLPQSRPRFFLICVHSSLSVPRELTLTSPNSSWFSSSLIAAHKQLPAHLKSNWLWWNLPEAPSRKAVLSDLIEFDGEYVKWNAEEETIKLLSMMTPHNMAKVSEAKLSGRRIVGTIYKRTRPENGEKIQRAEVRFDEVAGCIRTPGGGSSRQTIIVVEENSVRTRLITTREAARLMGLPDAYKLPTSYNQAYHLIGDGVAVPVVNYISEMIFKPILKNAARREDEAA